MNRYLINVTSFVIQAPTLSEAEDQAEEILNALDFPLAVESVEPLTAEDEYEEDDDNGE